MSLSSGTRLGPYSILAPLGEGGMGEVYRARDTRLGREVAIKVMSSEASANQVLRARFEAEARTVSNLSHPNICALYDVGREDVTDYFVMELVEGETLAVRLARGPLQVPELLRTAVQITDALDRAHRAGIVHRDLKPANVMLTKAGAKLMDFGLARTTGILGLPVAGSGTGAGSRESPTLAAPLTAHGTIVGTLQYLSPEQLEGREADGRSDLWAVGCLMYEMASGRRAFVAASPAALVAAIMEREPVPLTIATGAAPPGFERVVMQCLAKDPDERWQTAADLRSELQWLAQGASRSGLAVALPARPHASSRRAGWLVPAVCGVVAVAALAYAWRAGHAPEPLAFRQLNFRREAVFQAAFAGDEAVVYSAATSGNSPQIWSVRPEYPEPQPIGTRGMHLLSASSKGELAILTGARYVWHRQFTGTLARMPLAGGAPREIQEGVRQADWSPDGSELAIIHEVAGKDRLEYPIGHVLAEGAYLTDVRVSPRGDRVAYFEHPRKWDDRGSVNTVDLKGQRTVLADGYWSERGLAWSPDGRELLFSASPSGGGYTVYAVTLGGARRVAYQPPGGFNIQAIARDGRWLATRVDFRYGAVVHPAGAPEDRDLSWLNTSHARALSQDGQTLLFAETALGAQYAVCLRKTDGSPVVRLGEGWPADLSPDGRSVLAILQSKPPGLVVYPTGPGETRMLPRGPLEAYTSAQWFRDGERILVGGNEPGRGERFYVQQRSGGAPRPVTPEDTRDGWISPDGTLVLARGSAEYSLYPTAGGEPRAVAGLTESDSIAHWSADGRSVLAYRRAEIPCRLERVLLDTGARSLFREIAPADRAGLLSLRGVFVTDDLRSYAYTTYYQVSSLFVSERGE